MLSIKRIDKLLEKMSRGEAWSFPAKLPQDDDSISVYSVDVGRGRCDNTTTMASLIPTSGVLYNLCDTAPSPCKDYCQIIVTLNEVIFRIWKISLRNNLKVAPAEIKNSCEDFPYDERVRVEVIRVFGRETYDYILNLVNGQIDYLPRLPRDLLIKIIQMLDLEDIARLSLVSKYFREICNSNELWENIYLQHSESSNITEQLYALAQIIGWKKLFFTNKLQLQVQLRRQAQRLQAQNPSPNQGCAISNALPSTSTQENTNRNAVSEEVSGDGLTSQNNTQENEILSNGHTSTPFITE